MEKLSRRRPDTQTIPVLLLSCLLYVFVIVITFGIPTITYEFIPINVLITLIPFVLILLISGRDVLALGTGLLIAFLTYYADACVFAARLTHLRISDFLLATQAMGVASHYKLVWTWDQTWRLVVAIAAIVLYAILRHFQEIKPSHKMSRIYGAFLAASLTAVLLVGYNTGLFPTSVPSLNEFNMNRIVNAMGLVGSWYSQLCNRGQEKPDGYSKEEAAKVLSTYKADRIETESPVNIIVVMNESLADFSLVGDGQFEDPLPNIHAMRASGSLFEGKLGVSIFGGGTSKTEWEFLTGNSLRFIPQDSTPFLSYINEGALNIAPELKDLGYDTCFFHPYYSEEWNRRAVYSMLGFDQFIAGDDLEGGLQNAKEIDNATVVSNNRFEFGSGLEYVRDFISDRQAYSLLEHMVDLSNNYSNDFLFCVTIQNHGGYDYVGPDFEAINFLNYDESSNRSESMVGELTGIKSSAAAVNQYLTLARLSDVAFSELINSLSQTKEKTLVIMFGDHQPALDMHTYLSYDETMHENVEEENYIVPYVVWSNYDIDYDFPEYISANYLSAVLKESARLPLKDWDKFRLDVMKSYPVITANYVLDKDYNVILNDEADDVLRSYAYVQYMRMFET